MGVWILAATFASVLAWIPVEDGEEGGGEE